MCTQEQDNYYRKCMTLNRIYFTVKVLLLLHVVSNLNTILIKSVELAQLDQIPLA